MYNTWVTYGDCVKPRLCARVRSLSRLQTKPDVSLRWWLHRLGIAAALLFFSSSGCADLSASRRVCRRFRECFRDERSFHVAHSVLRFADSKRHESVSLSVCRRVINVCASIFFARGNRYISVSVRSLMRVETVFICTAIDSATGRMTVLLREKVNRKWNVCSLIQYFFWET